MVAREPAPGLDRQVRPILIMADQIYSQRLSCWRSTLGLNWIPSWGSDPIPGIESDAEPFDLSNLLI
jgi:hypothetical protein